MVHLLLLIEDASSVADSSSARMVISVAISKHVVIELGRDFHVSKVVRIGPVSQGLLLTHLPSPRRSVNVLRDPSVVHPGAVLAILGGVAARLPISGLEAVGSLARSISLLLLLLPQYVMT